MVLRHELRLTFAFCLRLKVLGDCCLKSACTCAMHHYDLFGSLLVNDRATSYYQDRVVLKMKVKPGVVIGHGPSP